MNIEIADKMSLVQKALDNVSKLEALLVNYDYDNIIIDTDALANLPMDPECIPVLIWEFNQLTLRILRSLRNFIAENQLSLDDPTLDYLANVSPTLKSTFANVFDYDSIVGLPAGGNKRTSMEIATELPYPIDLQAHKGINDVLIKILLGFIDKKKFAGLMGVEYDDEKIVWFINNFFLRWIRKYPDAIEALPEYEEAMHWIDPEGNVDILALTDKMVAIGASFREIIGPAMYAVSIDLFPNMIHHYQATWSLLQLALMMK